LEQQEEEEGEENGTLVLDSNSGILSVLYQG